MKTIVHKPVSLVAMALTTGLVLAISFLETPMKFQLSGMTLPLALEMGKMMFEVSSKFQWAMVVIILMEFIFLKESKWTYPNLFPLMFMTILALQYFWMLPVLDHRADFIIEGKTVPPSELHNAFIYSEVLKFNALIFGIVFCFKRHKPVITN